MFPQVGVVLQQLQPEREQIVEVHGVRRAFAGDITFCKSAICGANCEKWLNCPSTSSSVVLCVLP
jgi:hypothetical protein